MSFKEAADAVNRFVDAPVGKSPIYFRGETEGAEPEEVGKKLALDLLEQGAAVVLGEVREVRR